MGAGAGPATYAADCLTSHGGLTKASKGEQRASRAASRANANYFALSVAACCLACCSAFCAQAIEHTLSLTCRVKSRPQMVQAWTSFLAM